MVIVIFILYQGILTMKTVFLGLVFVISVAHAENFNGFPRTEIISDILVDEHGFERSEVERWMSEGKYRQASVTNLSAPAEKQKSYTQYKPMFVTKEMVRNGQAFAKKYQSDLKSAEEKYGVPSSIITAIIGIETRYGESRGRYRTFDSLGSLAVTEGRRADYFQREWIRYLLIMRDQKMDPLETKGSYAGAMGYPQFMPTSYVAYAVDHDGDGDIDIWNDVIDSIGSVANYLKENGWQRNGAIYTAVISAQESDQIKLNNFDRDRTLKQLEAQGWTPKFRGKDDDLVFPVRLEGVDGPEYWLGYKNFWVVSRYNRSFSYTMAVVQLADAISTSE
ncbi:lytic murein transglycosylase B [Reinekea sp.]|jgi:membrane-bound lytic murein transglycosylase B|uniref:lytic murein transglycosylase B n=1 Tax=Reinekea sp. TaxID=1970455 RepID=UPI00398A420C